MAMRQAATVQDAASATTPLASAHASLVSMELNANFRPFSDRNSRVKEKLLAYSKEKHVI